MRGSVIHAAGLTSLSVPVPVLGDRLTVVGLLGLTGN